MNFLRQSQALTYPLAICLFQLAFSKAIEDNCFGFQVFFTVSCQAPSEKKVRLQCNNYDPTLKYETRKSNNKPTGMDSLGLQNKYCVIHIENGTQSKVYNWNMLKSKRLIEDNIGVKNIAPYWQMTTKVFSLFLTFTCQLPLNRSAYYCPLPFSHTLTATSFLLLS